MKRILFLLIVLIAIGADTVSAQAELKFDKTSFNFGAFPEDKPQTTVFTFTNVGDKPLVIHQAMPTCGCTVPTFTKKPINPGEKGLVKVTYNGKGKPAGHFKTGITIRSNAKNRLARIYIEGILEVKE